MTDTPQGCTRSGRLTQPSDRAVLSPNACLRRVSSRISARMAEGLKAPSDAVAAERFAGMPSFATCSTELGAEPCTPIYVYNWRVRVGGYVALVGVLIGLGYLFVVGR